MIRRQDTESYVHSVGGSLSDPWWSMMMHRYMEECPICLFRQEAPMYSREHRTFSLKPHAAYHHTIESKHAIPFSLEMVWRHTFFAAAIIYIPGSHTTSGRTVRTLYMGRKPSEAAKNAMKDIAPTQAQNEQFQTLWQRCKCNGEIKTLIKIEQS